MQHSSAVFNHIPVAHVKIAIVAPLRFFLQPPLKAHCWPTLQVSRTGPSPLPQALRPIQADTFLDLHCGHKQTEVGAPGKWN